MNISWFKNVWLASLIIILLGLAIYHQVFTAHFAYLDDAWMLWHRTDTENYRSFASSGRLLTAIVSQNTITRIDNISQLQLLRIISLLGWIINSLFLFFLSRVWVKRLGLNEGLPLLLALLCICSSSVTVHIGWTICFQFFCGFLPALLGGHLLFVSLTAETNKIKILGFSILAIILGMVSLLFYQSMYGVFLLPFVLWWVSIYQYKKITRISYAAGIHLVTYICYFAFFKYYIDVENIAATDRAEIVFNPLQKISFFFSTPFSQAWSLNHLINSHNIVSQLLPFLLFGTWIFVYYRQSTGNKLRYTLLGIIGVLFLLGLSYLPSIAASQNYSSYRTMMSLNICASAIFVSTVLNTLKGKYRLDFAISIVIFNLFFAYHNFNRLFVDPLQKEYSNLKSSHVWNTLGVKDTVVFIRPDGESFKSQYDITSYKDEYGVPSTFRDWTPDPLIRQLIYEKSSSMDIAKRQLILQFSSLNHYEDSLGNTIKKPVIIDMNEIIRKKR